MVDLTRFNEAIAALRAGHSVQVPAQTSDAGSQTADKFPPDGFEGATSIYIGHISYLVSPDGSRYARAEGDNVSVDAMPGNGRLAIDDLVIQYSGDNVIVRGGSFGSITVPSGETINVNGGNSANVSFSGVSISGGGYLLVNSSNSGHRIDEQYSGITQVICKADDDLLLALHDNEYVRVEGEIGGKEPKVREGTLTVSELDGALYLPRGAGLKLEVLVSDGDIDGEIAHPGSVRTRDGDITLTLKAPLNVKATTSDGDVEVTGMGRPVKGIYTPAGFGQLGTLSVSTGEGDITINYLP